MPFGYYAEIGRQCYHPNQFIGLLLAAWGVQEWNVTMYTRIFYRKRILWLTKLNTNFWRAKVPEKRKCRYYDVTASASQFFFLGNIQNRMQHTMGYLKIPKGLSPGGVHGRSSLLTDYIMEKLVIVSVRIVFATFCEAEVMKTLKTCFASFRRLGGCLYSEKYKKYNIVSLHVQSPQCIASRSSISAACFERSLLLAYRFKFDDN